LPLCWLIFFLLCTCCLGTRSELGPALFFSCQQVHHRDVQSEGIYKHTELRETIPRWLE
jgi:hypothetical protein